MVQELERSVHDPKIYPGRVNRSIARLLKGLSERGLNLDEAYYRVDNLPPRVRKVIGENNFRHLF